MRAWFFFLVALRGVACEHSVPSSQASKTLDGAAKRLRRRPLCGVACEHSVPSSQASKTLDGAAKRLRRRPLSARTAPAVITTVCSVDDVASTPTHQEASNEKSTASLRSRGGGSQPSFKWAVLHNWLYFIALGFSIPNLPRVIATIVNDDGSAGVTPMSTRLKGDVEAIDKILTFMGVGFLGALSDVKGRKPLMAWSALGFGLTLLIQGSTTKISHLYLADVVDGISSCMGAVCTSYVADCSAPEKRAINLGVFQGLSVGGAFIIGFPVGGVLGAKLGYRVPLLIGAGLQLFNALLIAFVTPESLPATERAGRKLNIRDANPIGSLKLLLGRNSLLTGSALVYFLVYLAKLCLDSQFTDYALYKFGWGPAQSGPLLVLVGLMLAVVPRLVVPRLGLRRSCLYGVGVFAASQVATGFAPSPEAFFASIFLTSIGCACVPALLAFIANQARPEERGAVIGAVGTVQELCGAIGFSAYSRLFAYAISDDSPMKLSGAAFLASAAVLVPALVLLQRTFKSAGASAFAFEN